jgi:tRNA 5-methylaminomethyl-2-thiouridine biosynthesis bifunctional protein
MLAGVLPAKIDVPHPAPWYVRPAAKNATEFAVSGGGVASAVLSLALLRRGFAVTLYCADEKPALGASGNRQGAVYPLLNGRGDTLENFFAHAFTFARRQYAQLEKLDVPFDHGWSGVTQLGYDEKSQGKIDGIWPEELAKGLSEEDAEALCGLPCGSGGITYPLGAWLCPAELTASLISLAETQGLTVHYGHRVTALESDADSQWTLTFADGRTAHHQAVVLANGADITDFSQTEKLPVYAVSGQVSQTEAGAVLRRLYDTGQPAKSASLHRRKLSPRRQMH